jgi:hypothetical protein
MKLVVRGHYIYLRPDDAVPIRPCDAITVTTPGAMP